MARSTLPRLTLAIALGALIALWADRGAGARPNLPPPPTPDHDFYVANVAPWVEAKCVECHRAGGGALRLTPPRAGLDDAARRKLDFEQIAKFVNPMAPWESRLYLKVLDPGDGGDPHVGGAFVRMDEPEHDTLLDFVSGATPKNLPPEVYLGEDSFRVKPGDEITLDGRDSYDRDREDMENLAFYWTLKAQPPDSIVALSDRRASRLQFKPDTGGSYVVELRVGDGKVWSAPRSIAIEVFDYRKVKQADPGGISGLEKVESERLTQIRRLYLDVLGRPPTPPEAISDDRIGVKRLAETILLRAEAGRAWYEEVTVRFGLIGDFRPASDEARDLPLRIPSAMPSPGEVERVLVLDPSFLRRHPPGRSLAIAIGELLFGRPPTQAELDTALKLAAGESVMRGDVELTSERQWLREITAEEDFERAALARRVERFLPSGDARRAVPKAWIALRERKGAWRRFQIEVLQSPRYRKRKTLRLKDDLTYVRSLFYDLLERKPTERELAALLHAVGQMPGDSAPLAVLAKVMIDSGEVPLPLLVRIKDAPRWLKDRFLRYLGRRPTGGELKAYGEALLHPQGGVELVVQALVTSPEYACR
ncbi:MAG: hypothetical protein QNJ98_16660 [Planctomycetota bacterium]|nr:hypothetical protein [Planctomycetota bacterium]